MRHIVGYKLIGLTRETLEWFEAQKNASDTIRKLILHDIHHTPIGRPAKEPIYRKNVEPEDTIGLVEERIEHTCIPMETSIFDEILNPPQANIRRSQKYMKAAIPATTPQEIGKESGAK